MSPPDWVALVGALHDAVDGLTAPLEARHGAALHCRRGCHGCCVDGLTVTRIEAERIAARYPSLLAEGRPGPVGGCAFLDADGSCRVYDVRPYVCRTQGLPLRWATPDGGEARDVCPVHADAFALTALPADALWTIGPFEARLAAWQAAAGAPEARIALRALFRTLEGGPSGGC